MPDNAEIYRRAAKIKCLVFDNDGVLTDGMVSINAEGVESKSYYIRDGFAFVMGRKYGLRFGIITGLLSPIVETRARQLKIEEVHLGFVDKLEVLQEIATRRGFEADEIAYMGDDIFDLPAMGWAGLGAAPADACREVLDRADWVAGSPGGRGAARDLIELVLKARGDWDAGFKEFSRT